MVDTLCRAIRISAFPRTAVIERPMFTAENNSIMPTGGELSAWFNLIVKFSSPGLGMFAIGLVTLRKQKLVVKSTLKSEKNLQLVTNSGMTIFYVSLIDCVLTFYSRVSFWHLGFQMRPFVNYIRFLHVQ